MTYFVSIFSVTGKTLRDPFLLLFLVAFDSGAMAASTLCATAGRWDAEEKCSTV